MCLHVIATYKSDRLKSNRFILFKDIYEITLDGIVTIRFHDSSIYGHHEIKRLDFFVV